MIRFLSILIVAAASLAAADLRVTTGDRLPQELADYLTREASVHWNARHARIAALRNARDLERRQQEFRGWLTQAMGGFPAKTPLNARITGGFTRDGYRVEHLIFESMPGFYVTANVYSPLNAQPPFPAVLGTAGHSATGKAIATYQYAWIGLAKRGFLVLAFDPPGQGERSEYFDKVLGKSIVSIGTRQHDMAGTQCLLTGSTFARYEAWDGIRAFDYLLTRKDVDPKRIGVAGNSGGGTQSAYLSVVEPRLAASVISCYMTGWEQLWTVPGPQDAEQDFPGFLSAGYDFGDFMLAFAPKPVTMLTGIQDFFPIAGARATFAETKKVFSLADAEVHAGFFEYDDPHGWSKPRREATYRWLTKWLQGREDDGAEPQFPTEPEANLNATPTGQLATSLGGETVYSLNLKRAEQQFAGRSALRADAAAVRKTLVRVLDLPARASVPAATEVETSRQTEARVTKLLLETQPGLHVAAVLFEPTATGQHPAVLWLDSRGKGTDTAGIDGLVAKGTTVLAIDLSGWGESAPPAGKSGYSGDWQLAQRAMLIGRPLPGIQTLEALRAYDFLRTRPGVDPSKISITGIRDGGMIALYATALEPRIASATVKEMMASFMTLARAKVHKDRIGSVVPGVLSEFDLPDLALAIAPRDLTLHSLRDALGNPLDRRIVEQEFAPAVARYANAKQHFRIED
ncbi:acetylxylan esterase [uncultured Paludibaculum sp.]|uniref:alpha/beta hydrolase family protein n=1 Tax=uncultured Paludibaculum sp. TaxID=1765020 RepID=UPI002AAAD751|nr:acetylxylan esterase [uncultured Paludibaculum sp.]